KYNSLNSLSKADLNDIIDIIKSIGTFNKKAKNILLIANKLLPYGKVINDRIFLESLSGVGRKTTNVVLSILFNEQCIAVDTHVTRGLTKKNDSVLEIEKKLTKYFASENLSRIHHQLVLFGRYYCKAQKPKCEVCKLNKICKNFREDKMLK
ncbi:MAG: endonuclease III, partial [Bacilli bacterium]